MKKLSALLATALITCLPSACAEPDATSETEMQVTQLTAEEIKGLDSDRAWINDLLSGHGSELRLTQTPADIPVLHSLLDNGPYTSDASSELVVFGTAFGDIAAREMDLHWVIVTDDHGSDFALQLQDKQVFVFPRDMLIKRVERGEDIRDIDLQFVLNGLKQTVDDQARLTSAAGP